MKKIVYALILILFCSSNLQAFALKSEVLKHVLKSGIENFVDKHKDTTAAVSVAVFTNQDILLERSFGFINIVELISGKPFYQYVHDHIFAPPNMTKAAPGVYKFTGFGMISPLFASADESGNIQYLTSFVTDFVKQNNAMVVFELFVIILFLISGFYGLVMLIIMLIKKLLKKEQILPCLRVGIYAASFAAIVNFFVFILSVFLFYASLSGVIIHGILFILLTVAVIFCIIKIALRAKIINLVKKQKRQLIITCLTGVIVVINVFYWQIWMFWI